MKPGPRPQKKEDPLLRFVRKQYKDPETGCRIWTKGKNVKGYGHFRVEGKPVYAHKWFYEYFFGPVKDGLELHHTCENKSCCNPGHLEPLTRIEHKARHRSQPEMPYRGPKQPPFKCGHSEEAENVHTYPDGKRRSCLTCSRESMRRSRQRKKTGDAKADDFCRDIPSTIN